MDKRLMHIFRIITACSSIVFTMTFIVVVVIESQPTWKSIQTDYREMAMSQTTNEEQLNALRHYKHEIHQLDLENIDRIDRCITCHTSVTDPDFQHRSLPHRTHSGDILQNHPLEKFGCTICHGGQGQALDQKNAHARDADVHWAQPLMAMQHIQSSCGQCHLTIFTNSNKIANTEIFQKGHKVFAREGCLGCHKARGVGGSVGPDLTEQGEKTKHEYSFTNVAGEHTIANWLYEHFKDPEMVSPGSEMLAIELDDAELSALVTFTLGMNVPDIPFDYFSVETLNEFKGQRDELPGEIIYPMVCSACHGEAGEGKNYEQFKMGVPSIGNQDFLSVASVNFLEFTLAQGRRRHMEAWTPRFSGLKQDELTATALFLRNRRSIASSWQEVAQLRGDQRDGELLYSDNCSMCHGQDGRAAQVVSISNADFLAVATDDFLYQTIRNGRGNAAMPAWGRLTSQQCADLLSYLRSWGPRSRSGSFDARGDARAGEQLYHYRCSRCHGTYGQGDTGPMLVNRELLAAASDFYLSEMIAHGRRGTAMFGWRTDVASAERLTDAQIADIIAFLRQKGDSTAEIIYAGANLGQASGGEKLYRARCVDCHGENGEGPKAPALDNQELLNAGTNGYLLATVSLGRGNTAMPSWGRGDAVHEKLSMQERHDVVAFLRKWQVVIITNVELRMTNYE